MLLLSVLVRSAVVVGERLAEGAVRSVFVEMVLERVENGCRVSLVDDQGAVEEFAADGADEAFGDGVVPSRRLPLIPTVGPEPSG